MPILVPAAPVVPPDGTVSPGVVDTGLVWLNDAADLTDAQGFTYVTALKPSVAVGGAVRVLASGRRRFVATADKGRSYAVTLEWNTPTQTAWLESHVGQLVCIRDDRGRKFYAVYQTVASDESTLWRDKGNTISLQLDEVTHSEAV